MFFSPDVSKPPDAGAVARALSAAAGVEDTGELKASKADSSRSAGAETGNAAGVGVTVRVTGEINPTDINR